MCEMREEGITFKVEAVADGYITSYSETFVFERRLDTVTGLTVNEADETLSWNDVANAEYYEYKINDGDWTRFNRTVSLKRNGTGRHSGERARGGARLQQLRACGVPPQQDEACHSRQK